jgi:FAD:protein FMN transferase
MPKLIEFARSFRAMSTGVEVVVCAAESERMSAESALSAVESLFYEVESRLSRFQTNSELSRLNRSGGRDFKASAWLYKVIQAGLNAAELTEGIFDPTILPYLEDAGYDRSIESLKPEQKTKTKKNTNAKCDWRKILLQSKGLVITLPVGCNVDLGGIAKGWAVDQAVCHLNIFNNFAINAGGDIYVGGTQCDGTLWSIGLEDPTDKKPNLVIMYLADAAVCTSTTSKRQWWVNGELKHHLIDPRTGEPAKSDVVSATVIAGSAVLAETISKSVIILGAREGLRLAESQNTEGFLVLEDGTQIKTAGFTRFLERRGVKARVDYPGLQSP